MWRVSTIVLIGAISPAQTACLQHPNSGCLCLWLSSVLFPHICISQSINMYLVILYILSLGIRCFQLRSSQTAERQLIVTIITILTKFIIMMIRTTETITTPCVGESIYCYCYCLQPKGIFRFALLCFCLFFWYFGSCQRHCRACTELICLKASMGGMVHSDEYFSQDNI